jgi:hypothetical protein
VVRNVQRPVAIRLYALCGEVRRFLQKSAQQFPSRGLRAARSKTVDRRGRTKTI